MTRQYIIILLATVCLFSHKNLLAQGEHSDINHNATGDAIEGRVAEGIKQLESNDLGAALETFKSILDRDPENPEANYRAGIIYMRQKQFKNGVAHLKRAVQFAPDILAYHNSLANAYEISRQNDLAIEEYKKVTEMAPPGSDDGKEALKKIDFLEATQYAHNVRWKISIEESLL